MNTTMKQTEASASVMAAHLAQSPMKQAPAGAQQTAEPDEATRAAMAAYQAKVAERKARNKDRTRILLGAFAATAVIIVVWNFVILAVLFPVLVGALIVAGRLWAGWSGDTSDNELADSEIGRLGLAIGIGAIGNQPIGIQSLSPWGSGDD